MKKAGPRILVLLGLIIVVVLIRIRIPSSLERDISDSNQIKIARDFFPQAERLIFDSAGNKVIGPEGVELGLLIDGSDFASAHPGFGGPIPFFLVLDNQNLVQGVVLLDSRETPSYLSRVKNSGLLQSWNGLESSRAQEEPVDSVSGATITSGALISSVRACLASRPRTIPVPAPLLSPRYSLVELLIAWSSLLAALFGFFYRGSRSRWLRPLVLTWVLLAVGIVDNAGLSLELFHKWSLSSPVNLLAAFGLFPLVLALISIGLNLATGKNFYCAWMCPFGCAQELIFRITPWQFSLPPVLISWGKRLRPIFLVGLTLLILLEGSLELSGFEPFSIFRPAYCLPSALILALLSLLSANFYLRPWCRLLCPTGALFAGLSCRHQSRRKEGKKKLN